MIEGHGDDLWRYGGMVRHNFSTNIHSAFDHSPLMTRLMDSVAAVTSYPEPSPLSLEAQIAGIHNCRPDEVLVTNGATEAIYLIAQQFAGYRSAILAPSFSEYQDACRMYGHEIMFFKSITEIPPGVGMVWLCNPNNPTGQVIPHGLLTEVVNENRDKVFVIDQAYSDYTLSRTLTAGEAIQKGNIILLGSLTKRFAVPGLRVGYAIGAGHLLAEIRKWRMPWAVNGLAIEGARYLLHNIDRYVIDAGQLHDEALRISDELSRMGINVTPTDCNFILCELQGGVAADMKKFLVENYGILIRDASNFEGLSPAHFRVAAQSPEENDLLIKAIGQWLTI